MCFFFNDTATTEIYTLSLHDALPIWATVVRLRLLSPMSATHSVPSGARPRSSVSRGRDGYRTVFVTLHAAFRKKTRRRRSEEHTSELQSRQYLVCRLLLEKKKYHFTR